MREVLFVNFATLDGPAMIEVLEPFLNEGHVSIVDYSIDEICGLDDRNSMGIIVKSFNMASKIAEALDKSGLDIRWAYRE